MFFMFYNIIFVLSFTYDVYSFSIHNLEGSIDENELNLRFNDLDVIKEKRKSIPNFFYVTNNSNALNLKSKIFDKMLSNEILSIKQHLQEKDINYGSSVYMTFKNSLQTPTLEVKQRWPIDKFLAIPKHDVKLDINNEHLLPNTDNKQTDAEKDKNEHAMIKVHDSNKNKIIEVRSLSGEPHHSIYDPFITQESKLHCGCTRTNAHTCSHRNSALEQITRKNEKNCTHRNYNVCTRTITTYPMSLTYPIPVYYYSPYFMGLTTDSYYTYYHPDMDNYIKLPKQNKHRKTKKPYKDEDLYISEEDASNELSDSEYNYENDKSKGQHLSSNKYRNKIHKNEDESYTQDLESSKLSGDYTEINDKKKIVDDIIEDLKDYYSDIFIKDCYCSLSTFKMTVKREIIYFILLLWSVV